MQFNSLAFLVFFPIVCALAAIFRAEKHMRLRHIMLLIASYVFYGWWNWKFCFLMLLMSAVAYVCALSHSHSGRKLPVITCVPQGVSCVMRGAVQVLQREWVERMYL